MNPNSARPDLFKLLHLSVSHLCLIPIDTQFLSHNVSKWRGLEDLILRRLEANSYLEKPAMVGISIREAIHRFIEICVHWDDVLSEQHPIKELLKELSLVEEANQLCTLLTHEIEDRFDRWFHDIDREGAMPDNKLYMHLSQNLSLQAGT